MRVEKNEKQATVHHLIWIVVTCFIVFAGCLNHNVKQSHHSYHELLSDFAELRNGMLICYNIMSYGAKWGEANYPIDSFNPQNLDCEQWAGYCRTECREFI